MKYGLLWTLSTDNEKTGKIPTAWPDSFEDAKDSCRGCRQLKDGTCYAWGGMLPRAMNSVIGAAEESEPERFSLENCIRRARRLRASIARAARLGPIGDPFGVYKRQLTADVALLREEGFAVLAYTHFWRRKASEHLRGFCRASCDDIEGAERAQSEGWAVSVILPWHYDQKTFMVGSQKGIVCPVQRGKAITCNDCRACDIERSRKPVGFLDHSQKARHAKARLLRLAA